MGLLSSIGNFIDTRSFPVVGITGVSTAVRLIAEPAKEITRAVSETIIGATIAAPTAVFGAVGAVIKTAFIKAPFISTAAVLAAPTAGIAIATSPTIREAIAGAPEAYIKGSIAAGESISGIIEEPTLAKGLEIIKQHPYLTAATAATLLATFGYSAILITNIISNARLKGFLKDEAAAAGVEPVTETTGGLVPEKVMVTDEGIPTSSRTSTITTGKRRRRKVKAAIIPSVRQNVSLIISNRSIGIYNKRYLNERILA
jgi:hypothetical protein